MTDCIFCKIVAGEIPALRVYEDAYTFAFLDIAPITPGHTLVIPREHHPNLYEIPADVWGRVMETVRILTPVVKRATGADGINIGVNNDPAAGQVVFHSHVHVIPRHEGDGYEHWRGDRPYRDGEAESLREEMVRHLS